MSEIARRIWHEPAVAIGFVVSLALLALALITDPEWDASVIAGIAAPFAAALGIRPFVTPTTKVDELLEVRHPVPVPPPPPPP